MNGCCCCCCFTSVKTCCRTDAIKMRHSKQNNNVITPHSDVWRLDYGIIIVYIRKLSADKYRQYLPARGTYGHYLPAILGSSTVRSVRLIYVWRWVVKRLCELVGCLDCIIGPPSQSLSLPGSKLLLPLRCSRIAYVTLQAPQLNSQLFTTTVAPWHFRCCTKAWIFSVTFPVEPG